MEKKQPAEFNKDASFEEKTRHLHYGFLREIFSREGSHVFIQETWKRHEQFQGRDLSLVSEDGGNMPIELKTDRHVTSPNIFLEDVSNSVTQTKGCTLKCESRVLSYGFCLAGDKELRRQYVFDMVALKEWYLKNREKYRLIEVPNKAYSTFGRIVPIKDVSTFIIAKRE